MVIKLMTKDKLLSPAASGYELSKPRDEPVTAHKLRFLSQKSNMQGVVTGAFLSHNWPGTA